MKDLPRDQEALFRSIPRNSAKKLRTGPLRDVAWKAKPIRSAAQMSKRTERHWCSMRRENARQLITHWSIVTVPLAERPVRTAIVPRGPNLSW